MPYPSAIDVANLRLILAPILGIAVLLVLILRLKVQAFIALLIASILVGLVAGMDPAALLTSMQNGMGGTLGFVATVVGLGAILGQILESSGGAEAMALTLVRRFGEKRAPWALMLAGFIIAIPVFFDVGFIILVPVLYALAAKSGRSLLYYGIPLLAGLAVTHSFVPPTPGPVAVAEIVGADLGWVILLGIVTGLPTAIVAGPLFGGYISRRIVVQAPAHALESLQTRPAGTQSLPSFGMVALIMGAPLVLILGSTASQLLVKKGIVAASAWTQAAAFAGHPFTALLVSTLLALYLLGVRRGFSRAELMDLSSKALAPAGLIILITGAGGVLKQVLIDSGIGKILAEAMSHGNLPPILLAWLLAVAVRIAQGSSTVAMITAAGIVAPMIENAGLSDAHLGLVVIAIASGATILSHVNDSGFWLVGKYFGLTEKQTLQSWTVMETLIAFCGLAFTLLLSWVL